MTPGAMIPIIIIGIIFTFVVIVPLLLVLRFLYRSRQKRNPSQQDIIFHKIMKYLKDDPDMWIITDYGSKFNYAPKKLQLQDGEYSICCNWPIDISFNKYNSRYIRAEFKKLRVRHSESKDNFLIDYLDDELNLQYKMNTNHIKFIADELTLWLSTEIEGKSHIDLLQGFVWYSDQADLVACEMRWSNDI